jgi:hypothetical protein
MVTPSAGFAVRLSLRSHAWLREGFNIPLLCTTVLGKGIVVAV